MMTKEKETYNGWTNYETWNVALWLANDQGTQEFWNEQALYALEHAKPSYSSQTQEQAATCALADQLKDDVAEGEFKPEVSGLYADLLNAALSSVNWYEIAEKMIEAAKEG